MKTLMPRFGKLGIMHRFRLLFVTVVFLLILGYFYKDNVLSFRFVDEEYNFAIGRYLTQKETLYEDIITNHQPMTHILSGLVQQLTDPGSIYSLIYRHRVAVFLWSTFWAIILSLRYGWIGFLFVVIYELTKSHLFGNLFLAEALVVYPLIFLIGLVILQKKELTRREMMAAGFCLSFLAFSLGPIWPTLGFLFILFLYNQRRSLKSTILYLLVGVLSVILPVLKYASAYGYLKIYLLLNLKYTLPSQDSTYYPESWYLTIVKSFLAPSLSFTDTGTNPILSVSKLLSLLFIISLIFLIHQRKYFQAGVCFFLLGLTNIRFIEPGTGDYTRFHLLPWYGSLIFISISSFIKRIKLIYVILIAATLITVLIYAKNDILIKRDLQKDFEINFSTHQDRGNAIKIMRDERDTVFVSPDAWLVYWQSDTNHLPKLFGYYTWMAGIPNLHTAIIETFETTPPTFFYCENCQGLPLEKYLDKYERLKKSGNQTDLFVLKSKLNELAQKQIDELNFHQFSW